MSLITADGNIRQFLDTNGDGTGTINAVGDYSSAAEIFYIQPPTSDRYVLDRLFIYVEDSGTLDAGSYGNDLSALTNGVTVRVSDDNGVTHNLTGGQPVKTNAQWKMHAFDLFISAFGTGNQALAVRWVLSASGRELLLEGENNDRLEVVLNDNFSHLVMHTFKVEGYKA